MLSAVLVFPYNTLPISIPGVGTDVFKTVHFLGGICICQSTASTYPYQLVLLQQIGKHASPVDTRRAVYAVKRTYKQTFYNGIFQISIISSLSSNNLIPMKIHTSLPFS